VLLTPERPNLCAEGESVNHAAILTDSGIDLQDLQVD
jgi:hypothetical protein